MRIIITGGAGFIGSHLAEALLRDGNSITVIDNFSTGTMENLREIKDRIKIIEGDLRDSSAALQSIGEADIVFHLAANYSVKRSSEDPLFDLQSNLLTTLNVLEAMRRNDIQKIVFTSSSTVYGETDKFPIPETAKLNPISNYGVSKLAAERYIKIFSKLYGINGLILRYANILGPRCNHGVVFDFVNKLNKNPKALLILGNGKQQKSYLDVEDCMNATLLVSEKFKGYDVFNIGSENWLTVDEIAKIVCDELGLRNTMFEYTGGKRGWPGDVSKFLLDVEKIKGQGWKPKYNIAQSIRRTVSWLKK